jgi:hypothetical protein
MISKNLTDITATDLLHLVENNVQERKTLEYKAALPDNSDSGKKEFLADVSSLANTEGGDLVFGLREVNGTLQGEIGIVIANADEEIARLENMARDGITPRIGLEVRAVDAENGNTAIIVRTKASLEAPHRVVFKGNDKFYKRNSNGKYAMDVGELRSAFMQTGEIVERIKRFRTTRIADIKAGDTPFPLLNRSSFFAIHILPLTAFNTSFRMPSSTLLALKEGQHNTLFQPYRASGWNQRINLDGVIAYAENSDDLTYTYTQLYGDGRIEVVETNQIATRAARQGKILPMYSVEGGTMNYVSTMLRLLTTLEFQPPFYVFVSLVGIEGCTVSAPSNNPFFDPETITEKELLLPEVVIENATDNLHHKFRPIFDLIYNAAGVSRSLNFDENDDFNPHS